MKQVKVEVETKTRQEKRFTVEKRVGNRVSHFLNLNLNLNLSFSALTFVLVFTSTCITGGVS
jgi:hypothetical protein